MHALLAQLRKALRSHSIDPPMWESSQIATSPLHTWTATISSPCLTILFILPESLPLRVSFLLLRLLLPSPRLLHLCAGAWIECRWLC